MSHPPAIADVPWTDAEALHGLIEAKPQNVTPLMLERLLDHRGLECLGDAPSRGPYRVAIWAPRDRDALQNATSFTLLVYHSELVVMERVVRALNILQALAKARRGRDV